MNDLEMEMQFADPDWQPASARPGRAPGEQALALPVEITHTPDPGPPSRPRVSGLQGQVRHRPGRSSPPVPMPAVRPIRDNIFTSRRPRQCGTRVGDNDGCSGSWHALRWW